LWWAAVDSNHVPPRYAPTSLNSLTSTVVQRIIRE
jgi:hypothetical protein